MIRKELVLLVLAAFMFVGCEKDEDKIGLPLESTIITAEVENGKNYESEFSSVKVIMDRSYYFNGHFLDIDGYYEVGSCAYIDGKFSLTLLEILESSCLISISDYFDCGTGVKISNRSARAGGMSINGFNKDGEFVDDFVYHKKIDNDRSVRGNFIYVDRDVTITDADGYTTYNLKLKKGWNMYFIKDNGYGYKQNIISEANSLKWYRRKDLPK
jgi:hypothetical protein